MKANNPNALLERDADKVHFRKAQQVADIKKKRGKK